MKRHCLELKLSDMTLSACVRVSAELRFERSTLSAFVGSTAWLEWVHISINAIAVIMDIVVHTKRDLDLPILGCC